MPKIAQENILKKDMSYGALTGIWLALVHMCNLEKLLRLFILMEKKYESDPEYDLRR